MFQSKIYNSIRNFSTKEAVYIISASRTPMASFNSVFSNISATDLGSIAIKDALDKSGINKDDINEVFGNVVSSGIGQAPARQASIKAGLSYSTDCTTINKVCSSGMKTIMLGSTSIESGHNDVVVCGGTENMSQIPHYLPQQRKGLPLGHGKVIDGLIHDGLWDAFDNHHMGVAAEHCAKEYNISREDQDAYALESYRRAKEAIANGLFKEEIVPVEVNIRRKNVLIEDDEEPNRLNEDKVSSLRPAFLKDGTVTAANASTINDGASALIIASESYVKKHNITPIAEILSYADAAQKPVDFTTAPAKATPLAIEKAGLTINDIDLFEINEAFSVVALANMKLLNLDPSIVNINGGAVAMGHPIGASGARIVTTLIHTLKQQDKEIGLAAICNGGGAASSIIIKNI